MRHLCQRSQLWVAAEAVKVGCKDGPAGGVARQGLALRGINSQRALSWMAELKQGWRWPHTQPCIGGIYTLRVARQVASAAHLQRLVPASQRATPWAMAWPS